MVKILITGACSYIGTSFEKYMLQWPDKYKVDTVDMIDGSWRYKDFRLYDTVFHVAGIAHQDLGKVTEEQKNLYYKINTELAVETAFKAKEQGVKQFIFMSSMIVYGSTGVESLKGRLINAETPVAPSNFYGDSKLKAERGIMKLKDDQFKVVILRPPMIYGKGSRGNYPLLAKYALILPVFPDINNKKSVLYIGNLTEFIKLMIDNSEEGVFHPQNREYTSTSHLIALIAETHGKKIRFTKFFNPLLKSTGEKIKIISKVFGDFAYDMQMSDYICDYRIADLKESVIRTEL